MSEPSKNIIKKPEQDAEHNEPAEDKKNCGYYYDDTHGYEVYCEDDETDDEDGKDESAD